MDDVDSNALNTNSEAMGDSLGLDVNQADNAILIAGNALDGSNKTTATMRVSVRSRPGLSQADMRQGLSEPQDEIEEELMKAADQTAGQLRKAPHVVLYEVRGAGLRRNDAVVCTWMGFRYDLGRGPMIGDTWICPDSSRTVKLSTSYQESRSALYEATINRMWQSLNLNPSER